MNAPVMDYRDRLLRVMEYVDDHLGQPLTLETLAEQACFSPFHFHRVFSACIGEGPLEYFRRLRIEKAALALIHQGQKSITEIAMTYGFSSSEVFCRAFRRQLGVTPGEYRRDPLQALRQLKTRTLPDLPDPVRPGYLVLSLVERPRAEALAVRSWNGYGDHLFKLWEEFCARARSLGLMGEGCQVIGLSLDDPFLTPQDRCRYVACVVPPPGVRLPRPIPSGLSARRLDAGTYVRLDIRSWVQDLQNAYRWFYLVWLSGEGSDWEPIDHPALEQYQEREGEKMIALQFPVRRRRS